MRIPETNSVDVTIALVTLDLENQSLKIDAEKKDEEIQDLKKQNSDKDIEIQDLNRDIYDLKYSIKELNSKIKNQEELIERYEATFSLMQNEMRLYKHDVAVAEERIKELESAKIAE